MRAHLIMDSSPVELLDLFAEPHSKTFEDELSRFQDCTRDSARLL